MIPPSPEPLLRAPQALESASRPGALSRTPGGVSEWLKETGCKPVGSAYAGSNPAPTISRTASHVGIASQAETASRTEFVIWVVGAYDPGKGPDTE